MGGKKTFNDSKKAWVIRKGKPKVKLRKYISDLARNLARINKVSYDINKRMFVAAFDRGGLAELDTVYMKELVGHLKDTEDALNNIKTK